MQVAPQSHEAEAAAEEPEVTTPSLHMAATEGLLEEARAILDHPEGLAAMHAEDEQGRTPLFLAASNGHATIVECLLHCSGGLGALDICDLLGVGPLQAAARDGHAEVVLQLLRTRPSAADIYDIYDDIDIINVQDQDGFTALMFAAQQGYTAVVQALLEFPACKLEVQAPLH